MPDKFNAEKIKGYKKLPEELKRTMEAFCENFFRAWENPEPHRPVTVQFVKDRRKGHYLKVFCANGEWYHVVGPSTWY